jgi:ParB family transcriptional regulator, chromosome partitioning protein
MTDQSDDVPPVRKQDEITGPEKNKTITVPIEQIVVDGERRPVNDAKVAELMESITSVGLLNPIIVVLTLEDGGEGVRLVAGLHRLVAMKRLRIATIQCTVLECDEALRVELAEIDENIIRHNPSPAEHAILTQRRSEIIKELAAQNGALTHGETPSKQALRRTGQKTGHDVASVRDQAKRTGESAGKIQRSKKRSGILGGLLSKVVGTTLDKGPELDALTKLPEAERQDLANRAASGEAVSARTEDRKPKPRPDRKSKTRRELAYDDFVDWSMGYSDLEELERLSPQIAEIEGALRGD